MSYQMLDMTLFAGDHDAVHSFGTAALWGDQSLAVLFSLAMCVSLVRQC
jgi:hypothetical protein